MDPYSNTSNLPRQPPSFPTEQTDRNGAISKISLIIILVLFLLLALLGFNLFFFFGVVLEKFFGVARNVAIQTLSMMGFYTGAVLNTTADVVSDTAKGGIDIAEGSVQSIGNLLQNKSNVDVGNMVNNQQWNMHAYGLQPVTTEQEGDQQQVASSNAALTQLNREIDEKKKTVNRLDDEINKRREMQSVVPDDSAQPVSNKWCPVGVEEGKGKCVSVKPTERCMYGKVYDKKEICEEEVSKDFSGYSSYENSVNWGIPPPPPPPAALAPPTTQTLHQELPGMPLVNRPNVVIQTAQMSSQEQARQQALQKPDVLVSSPATE